MTLPFPDFFFFNSFIYYSAGVPTSGLREPRLDVHLPDLMFVVTFRGTREVPAAAWS